METGVIGEILEDVVNLVEEGYRRDTEHVIIQHQNMADLRVLEVLLTGKLATPMLAKVITSDFHYYILNFISILHLFYQVFKYIFQHSLDVSN